MLRLVIGVLFVPTLLAWGRDLVIFDTDSGVFGDDGAALVMLVRSPSQIALQGVTVVSGNVWATQGAEYMARILDMLKRPTLPLYLGAEAPLMHTAEMAKEEARRWDPLSYIGAFAMPHPEGHISRLSTRKPKREAAAFIIS